MLGSASGDCYGYSSHGFNVRRTISSPFTFFFKVVTPSLWIAFGLCVTLSALLDPSTKNVFAIIALFVMWTGVTTLINYRNNFPLKRARLGDGVLVVSNYVREVRVSITNIDNLEASGCTWRAGWWRWPPCRVIITLKQSTEFGKTIMIIPGSYYKDVVDEIRAAIETQRRAKKES
ncbi:MAG TPA: hypothetical protein VNS63_18320 [Blastocatellia bacterium]|nr:hypothetical protein [Blastocatellia bacterium]